MGHVKPCVWVCQMGCKYFIYSTCYDIFLRRGVWESEAGAVLVHLGGKPAPRMQEG